MRTIAGHTNLKDWNGETTLSYQVSDRELKNTRNKEFSAKIKVSNHEFNEYTGLIEDANTSKTLSATTDEYGNIYVLNAIFGNRPDWAPLIEMHGEFLGNTINKYDKNGELISVQQICNQEDGIAWADDIERWGITASNDGHILVNTMKAALIITPEQEIKELIVSPEASIDGSDLSSAVHDNDNFYLQHGDHIIKYDKTGLITEKIPSGSSSDGLIFDVKNSTIAVAQGKEVTQELGQSQE